MHDPRSHAARGSNLVFEMGDTLLSAAGALDPEFTVVPEHPAAVQRAPVVESVDNYLSRKLSFRENVGDAALHAYLYGRAILKIGYDSEFGWSPKLDIGEINQPYGMSLSQFDPRTKYRIEHKDTTPGMPWLAPVLPHDIIVPWGTIRLKDAPWVAHRIVRENKSIKADPKYKNTSSLKANLSIQDFVASYENVGADRIKFRGSEHSRTSKLEPIVDQNELWEIHDRRDLSVKVICRDHKKFLRDEPDAIMRACGMPFVSGTFVTHPRSFWTTPLAYYLGQIQADEYDISVQEEKQRRIAVLRFIAAKGFMSPEKLQKLISGDVGAVEFAEAMEGLRDKIIPFPTGQLFDFALQHNNVRQTARSTIGFSRNQMGEFDAASRRTKGEATLVAQGSLRRESPRVQMIRDLYLSSMSKTNQVIFAYWSIPRPVLVDREWKRYTGDEIKGDYLYDLSLSAKRDLSKAQRKVEAIMMLQQLGPLLQGIDPQQIMLYLNDAANDPAFERLLGLSGGQRQQQQGAQQNANL
jgi:hypothetical protein